MRRQRAEGRGRMEYSMFNNQYSIFEVASCKTPTRTAGVEPGPPENTAIGGFLRIFPCYGKMFSTVWKTWAWAGMAIGLAFSAQGEGGAELALRLNAEGQREAAAVEFRRLALGDADAESAGRWFWFAANEYALAGKGGLSDQMLDRAEDCAPFALALPVSWLRAENALKGGDWPSAAFHFESLGMKAGDEGLKEFSARGAAAAHLREGDVAAARGALAGAPGEVAAARGAIEGYAGGRDKKPWVGGVLGLVPGLGYAYSGEWANAARSIILNGLFIWGMAEAAESEEWGIFAVVAFGEITWYSGSIYGGVDAAHRHNRRRLDEAANAVRGEARLRPDLGQVPVVSLKFEF